MISIYSLSTLSLQITGIICFRQGMESDCWMWLPKEDHMPDINPEERNLTPDPLPLSLRLYINTQQLLVIYYSDTELMYTVI